MSTCANPILLGFVLEWLETAQSRSSKGIATYNKAYNSLKACPMKFDHPLQLKALNGFGDKLCSRLTDKLKDYCQEEGLEMPAMPHGSRKRISNVAAGDDQDPGNSPSPAKRPRKMKSYVPALRSGPYALVLALATLNEYGQAGLTKLELINLAQPHCDSSFTAPSDPTKFYTAWSSMKTLESKELVYSRGRPEKRYLLTEDGWDTAKRIKKSHDPAQGRLDTFTSREDDLETAGLSPTRASSGSKPTGSPSKPNMVDIIPLGQAVTSVSSLPDFSPIVLQPGSFTVELVVDNREVRTKKDRDYIEVELEKKEINCVTRPLELGDCIWVARTRDPMKLQDMGVEGDEIVLDYIVERKRLDDLISSIKDGRFHEQKFRLKKSGIKNVIYIIEEISLNDDHAGKYQEAVQSAIATMQVVSGYFVKKTTSIDDTIRYLARMTRLLKEQYEKQPLHIIPTKVLTAANYLPLVQKLKDEQPSKGFHISYPALASLSSKSDSLTLRDVYLKMLMCIKGVTGEKALEIQKRWKTPMTFIEAYQACDEGDDGKKQKFELVMKEMGNLAGRKKIAKALSVNIAKVWGCEGET
ncbi:hypothetical protein BJ875DRAFT_58065 [Amylocarpus encephaloides]|uniref:Crossover junction endonuclease MUS81 n=1 Tax=Amylocarpus encephaloides TaxID=45428 RepID=A0A9P7YG24_9HELO|nr:hypothetical protein BJ875DRAFT_58065 [Amylocarpus encephaloides]